MPTWKRALTACLLVGLSVALVSPVAKAQVPGFQIEAKAAYLVDFQSRQLLYQLNPDTPIPPASLTKLMTLWLAHKAMKAGKLRFEDPVRVSERAWAALPQLAGSSLMFLEPGQQVTVGEILKGIAVASGNDACIALAEHMAGSVEAFVALMNSEARALGLTATRFVDPHGLSDENVSTARDMATLALTYIQAFPDALAQLHSQKEFTYPLDHNLNEFQRASGRPSNKQYNYNKLLWDTDLQVDGLKTGFVDAAGYNLIVTATEAGSRLVGVLLGTASEEARAEQGKALLLYGFRNFVTLQPLDADETLATVRVWKGAAEQVELVPAATPWITVPRGDEARVVRLTQSPSTLVAPVAAGEVVGHVSVVVGEQEVTRVDLITRQAVEPGGLFKRLWDSVTILVLKLLKKWDD